MNKGELLTLLEEDEIEDMITDALARHIQNYDHPDDSDIAYVARREAERAIEDTRED